MRVGAAAVEGGIQGVMVSFLNLENGVRDWARTDALLTRMSSLPPVSFETSSWQVLMLSALVTSRARAVMPMAAMSLRTAGLRAVAMTCTPSSLESELFAVTESHK